MAIRTTLDEGRPTHHFSLTDGQTELGFILSNGRGEPDPRAIVEQSMPRVAMQMRSGDPDYSDFNLPFSPITQKDWSGGRGSLDFKDDKTRYCDAVGLDTIYGKVALAPLAELNDVRGSYTINYSGDGISGINPHPYKVYATKIQVSQNLLLGRMSFKVKLADDSAPSFIPKTYEFMFYIFSDNSNAPGSLLAVRVQSINIENPFEWFTIGAHMDYELVANTPYWVGFSGIQYEFSTARIMGGPSTGKSVYYGYANSNFLPSSVSWSGSFSDVQMAVYLYEYPYLAAKFFEYKGVLCLVKTGYGLISSIGQFGKVGRVTADIGFKEKFVTNLTGFPNSTFVNRYILITSGKGYDHKPNYRKIVKFIGGTSAEITVDKPFDYSLDSTTTFVILSEPYTHPVPDVLALENPGGNFAFTGKPTSVVVHGDTIWIARGRGLPILKLKSDADNNFSQTTDGSNEADYLAVIPGTDGKYRLWRAIASTAEVSYSETFSYNAATVFSTPIVCGNPARVITNLVAYGNPPMPYVMKEDGFGSINNNVYAEVPIQEFKSMPDYSNGSAALQKDVYLYMSFKGGLERFYDNRLDDYGVNRDEGLPKDRVGNVVKLISTPGKLICAIGDSDLKSRSGIYIHNGMGWHEIYTTPFPDNILDIYSSGLPYRQGARIYLITHYGNIMSFPIPVWENELKSVSSFAYAGSGHLITSWYSGAYKEIEKYWHSITLFGENLAGDYSGGSLANVYYQLDGEDKHKWTPAIIENFSKNTVRFRFSSDNSITSKRVRLKIVLKTDYDHQTWTPVVRAITMETIERISPKKAWQITFMYADRQTNLQGEREDLSIEQVKAILDRWADSDQRAAPLIARNLFNGLADNVYVFIEPPQVRYVDVNVEGQLERRAVFTTTVMSI